MELPVKVAPGVAIRLVHASVGVAANVMAKAAAMTVMVLIFKMVLLGGYELIYRERVVASLRKCKYTIFL